MATLGLGGAAAAALAALCLGTGCSSIGYYGQSVQGHAALMRAARPVAEVVADEAAAPALRERLQLSQRMRDFAVRELKLPDNASYRRYADLKRSAVVWNVVAARPLSLELKTWCFAVLGCVGYRGYFAQGDANALAAQLKAEGYEVSVYGVPAYSTLGWLNWAGGDPLLNTFIRWPEGELARLIFHELAHQVVYVSDDTAFNESFATAVERLGGQRWLAEQAAPAAREEYERFDARRRQFKALTQAARARLAAVYAGAAPEAAKLQAKAETMAEMRAQYARLKAQEWGGFSGYDGWFERANNASLSIQGAYDDFVPGFERIHAAQGGDWPRFYAEVARLAALPRAERRAILKP